MKIVPSRSRRWKIRAPECPPLMPILPPNRTLPLSRTLSVDRIKCCLTIIQKKKHSVMLTHNATSVVCVKVQLSDWLPDYSLKDCRKRDNTAFIGSDLDGTIFVPSSSVCCEMPVYLSKLLHLHLVLHWANITFWDSNLFILLEIRKNFYRIRYWRWELHTKLTGENLEHTGTDGKRIMRKHIWVEALKCVKQANLSACYVLWS